MLNTAFRYRKVGGIHFVTLFNRFGFNFYVKR